MNIKNLKTGSLSLLFNLGGTDYSIKLWRKDENYLAGEDGDEIADKKEDTDQKTVKKYKVELKAGHRNVLIEKADDGKNAPEYKVTGEGMEKDEMVAFGHNWVAMVFGSLDGFGLVQGNLNMKIMGLEPFFHMFNHFFGKRLQELVEEIEQEDMEEDLNEEEKID